MQCAVCAPLQEVLSGVVVEGVQCVHHCKGVIRGEIVEGYSMCTDAVITGGCDSGGMQCISFCWGILVRADSGGGAECALLQGGTVRVDSGVVQCVFHCWGIQVGIIVEGVPCFYHILSLHRPGTVG